MLSIEERILDAAMSVFAKEGYTGATTRKIAVEAGVNEVTLFRKFKSKENLLKVVIDKNREDAHTKLDSILLMEKNADVPTCLRTLGQNFMLYLEERMNFIIMLIAEGRRRPEIPEILSSIPNMMIEHLSEYFKEQIEKGNMRKVNVQAAAFTYTGFIFQISLKMIKFNKKLQYEDQKALDDFIDIFTRGILKNR